MRKLYIILCVVLFGAIVFFYARFVEPRRITISEVTIQTDKLSNSSQKLKIVLLSDLHMLEYGGFEQRIVNQVNEIQPDIIFITGDFLKSVKLLLFDDKNALNHVLEEIEIFLKNLKSPLGIWAVRGNYEIVIQKEVSDLVLERLRKAGIIVLCNQSASVEFHGNSFSIIGVDYSDFHQGTVADFKITEDSGKVIEAGSSGDNSYSHFLGSGSNLWQDYEYSGRMKFSDSSFSGLGVTVYSQFGNGYDKFYRLRWWTGYDSFYLDSHGINFEPIPTGVSPRTNQWYSFKIAAETSTAYTRVTAKIWPESDVEPRNWQAQIVDTSIYRLKKGTIGLWSWGTGKKNFDDLKVFETVTTRISLNEDFNSYQADSDPDFWLDYGIDSEGLTIAAASGKQDVYTILLSHSPDLIHEAAKQGINLMLSGHTHGGQVCLPGIGALISPAKLGRKYNAGKFEFNDTILYITRGLGHVLIPLRLFCPPEITVISIEGTREESSGRYN